MGGSVPLYLAPMAGVSEPPFRRLCREFGADVVLSEFLSSEGLRRGVKSVHDGAYFTAAERPIGIQIYGSDPAAMADAAALVEQHYGPDFVDINFGCPVKKVVRRNGGSGCLQDLGLVERIIRAVRAAVSVPVTVKTRSGWDEATRDPVGVALRCQDAGAQALTLHPRTRAELYSGHARWDEIAQVKAVLTIPVIGNGDIRCAEDAARMHRHTACDGIMIARGSFGNPWIFARARAFLDGMTPPPEPDPEERVRVALAHARLQREIQGDSRRTAIEFRKHLCWYTRGLPSAADLRRRLNTVESIAAVEDLFREHLAHVPVAV
jgi:nifR3 family TIM-barrel protein